MTKQTIPIDKRSQSLKDYYEKYKDKRLEKKECKICKAVVSAGNYLQHCNSRKHKKAEQKKFTIEILKDIHIKPSLRLDDF